MSAQRKPRNWISRLRTRCKNRSHEHLLDHVGFVAYVVFQAYWMTDDEVFHASVSDKNLMDLLAQESLRECLEGGKL